MRTKIILALVLLVTFAVGFANAEEKEKDLGFHNSSELGFLVVGGNTESEALNLKTALDYTWEMDILKFAGYYFYSTGKVGTSNTLTGRNWGTLLRYERVITPDMFNMYAEIGYTGDKFQGFETRLKPGIGVKYFIVKNESTQFFTEVGYEMQIESQWDTTLKSGFGDKTGDLTTHFGKIRLQADHKYSPSVSVGIWVEYLPALSDPEFTPVGGTSATVTSDSSFDQLNFSPYVTAALSEMFSLKFAYEGYYRGTRVGTNEKYLDFKHTTSLVATF